MDDDFADAARAGDVFEFVRAPFASDLAPEDVRGWRTLLDDVGLQVAWHRMEAGALSLAAVQVALDHADRQFPDSGLVCDLFRILTSQGGSTRERSPYISDQVIPSLSLQGSSKLIGTRFSDCLVDRLGVELSSADWVDMPTFKDVHFETVEGVSGQQEFPQDKFDSCTFGSFPESVENTSDILSLPIDDESKVVLVLLRKLYKQRGTGRKDSALRRGGLNHRQQALVSPVLSRLQGEGLVVSAKVGGSRVWLPVATARQRALQILGTPLTTTDEILHSSP